jgi:hypothetical protein
MFKNLYRLRLLDFFELTAATGVALYVYQSGAWYEHEKPWLIGALATSALLIWTLTRVGNAQPTAGQFLATYAGALLGLIDLSPWMVIFTRATLIEWALFLFDDPQFSPLWAKILSATLVAALMLIPALIVGVLWFALSHGVKLLAGKTAFPSTLRGRIGSLAPFGFAFLLVATGTYFLWRPQIRHVRTIRVPHSESSGPFSSTLRGLGDYASVERWQILDDSDRLAVLRSDNRFFEFLLNDGSLVSHQQLHDGEFSAKRSRKVPSTVVWFPQFERLFYSNTHEGRTNLLRIGPQFQLYDLATGLELDNSKLRSLQPDMLLALSQNARFALLQAETPADSSSVELSIWDMQTLRCIRSVETDRETIENSVFHLDNAGKTLRTSDNPRASDTRASEVGGFLGTLYGASFRYRDPEITNDGRWRLTLRGLWDTAANKNLLTRYAYCDLHGCLDLNSGRVAMFAIADDGYFNDEAERSPAPILEHLLSRAHHSQITLFDPATNTESTSWLRSGIFHRPNIISAQFTPDGHHLIIQDADASADLFHVFAMP